MENIQVPEEQQPDAGGDISSSSSTTSSQQPPANPGEECGCVRLGKCKWFNVAKGWGFLTPNDGGQEVFVHQSVIKMSGFRSLGEQEEVEFECHRTARGLEATRVSGRSGDECHGSTYRPRINRRTRRMRCYNCGEFANHIASECALGPQPKRCHRCRGEDHLHADCPNRNVDSLSRGRATTLKLFRQQQNLHENAESLHTIHTPVSVSLAWKSIFKTKQKLHL